MLCTSSSGKPTRRWAAWRAWPAAEPMGPSCRAKRKTCPPAQRRVDFPVATGHTGDRRTGFVGSFREKYPLLSLAMTTSLSSRCFNAVTPGVTAGRPDETIERLTPDHQVQLLWLDSITALLARRCARKIHSFAGSGRLKLVGMGPAVPSRLVTAYAGRVGFGDGRPMGSACRSPSYPGRRRSPSPRSLGCWQPNPPSWARAQLDWRAGDPRRPRNVDRSAFLTKSEALWIEHSPTRGLGHPRSNERSIRPQFSVSSERRRHRRAASLSPTSPID